MCGVRMPAPTVTSVRSTVYHVFTLLLTWFQTVFALNTRWEIIHATAGPSLPRRVRNIDKRRHIPLTTHAGKVVAPVRLIDEQSDSDRYAGPRYRVQSLENDSALSFQNHQRPVRSLMGPQCIARRDIGLDYRTMCTDMPMGAQ